MLINLKVKTLDARTHDFSIDNELTIRQFKDQIAEKTNIAAENQRIIYQGRVLADDKQVKEYDVDGKVLHVAERPPFSQRGANARNNDEPMRTFRNVSRPPPGSMRTSPYFRALDGMLVGTMAIPVNNGPLAGTRQPPNRFTNSSSFCINRITVAMHMIDCANNIAAYLENPAVGLNNQSLDILQRGRWSMESTVVEVGVSSTDLPRNNNIIDIVQDAVTAALSRNTGGRNYTVVQLPTVYTNESGETSQQRGTEAGTDGAGVAGVGSDGSGETTAAAVIIEDVIDEIDDDAADWAANRTSTPTLDVDGATGAVGGESAASSTTAPSSSTDVDSDGAAASGSAGAASAAGDNATNVAVSGIGPRRRTRPQVLANVIQRYRTVQTRLSPFVDRYYEILDQDPSFEENDTTGRENAQRIFDRVSEAFHYLSHAQHAISDLMLDLSQPGPRVLTCRPILVEQSGYIRSNNIFTPNLVASPIAEINPQVPDNAPVTIANQNLFPSAQQLLNSLNVPPQASPPHRVLATPADVFAEARRAWGAAGAGEASGAAPAAAAAAAPTNSSVEDPVDEPMVAPNATGPGAQQPRPEMDPQVQMARLIQAVVNSATNDGDVHVEFNSPNIMSINLPVHVMTAAVRPAAAGAPATAAAATSTTENAAATNNGETTAAAAAPGGATPSAGASTSTGREPRASTLPTTATQTRSTSRPQIQIGGNNNWGGRIAPTHTAFDRFLPCNSHHIREPEPLPHNNNNNNNNNRSTNTAPGSAIVPPQPPQINFLAERARFAAIPDQREHLASAGSAVAVEGGATATSATNATAPVSSTSNEVVPPPVTASSPQLLSPANTASNLRTQLRSFLNDSVFDGAPINEQTIPAAIGRALEWFGDSLIYLTQYERLEYNARDSVCNILRQSLRLIIELCSAAPDSEISVGTERGQFEQRLEQICEQFRKRLYSVLFLCLGSANAELYWRQFMRLLWVSLRSNFRTEAVDFLCIYTDPTIPTQTDTVDAQQFLVLRSTQSALPTVVAQQQTLDNDIEMAEVAGGSGSSNSSNGNSEVETSLPTVNVGSEPWHINFANDWLPVITRDLETQSEHNRPQPAYSDAYISGMSAKRRKIIQTAEKPSATVECLIASGVQRALQSAGLGGSHGSAAASSSISADAVMTAIANDAGIQASYTEAVRNNTRERIKQDVDYKSNKYPQIAKFAEQK